jgi:hypothetical protein
MAIKREAKVKLKGLWSHRRRRRTKKWNGSVLLTI